MMVAGRRRVGAVLLLVLIVTPAAGAVTCPTDGERRTAVAEVQAGHEASPLDAAWVTVEGVVAGDFLGRNRLDGFFLQERSPGPGADRPAGVFVYLPARNPNVNTRPDAGDLVRVTGQVDAFHGQIQVSHVQGLVLCGRVGVPEARELPLPMDGAADLRRRTAMLVQVAGELTVTGHHDLARFGTFEVAAGGRLFVPTNGPDGSRAENQRRRLLVDDGELGYFPEPTPYLGEDGTLRVGDTLDALTGILTYQFGRYRLHPTEDPAFHRANPRPEPPAEVAGEFRVAAFNVENYFITLGERGAGSPEALERQRAKLVAAVEGLQADVLALSEVENDPAALKDFVEQVNGAMGGDVYAAAPPPADTGDDAIKVAFMYRPGRVELVGRTRSGTGPVHKRPPLAARFRPVGGGDPFKVVTAHFKSKINCPDRGDVDRGQGCWNRQRVREAESLKAFVADLRAGGVGDVLVIGDLNAYGAEDPVERLRDAGWMDLVARHLPPERHYTSVYRGASGYLDHAFAVGGMADRVADTIVWHINADEPRALGYELPETGPDHFAPTPYRASDHDPVVVGID